MKDRFLVVSLDQHKHLMLPRLLVHMTEAVKDQQHQGLLLHALPLLLLLLPSTGPSFFCPKSSLCPQ